MSELKKWLIQYFSLYECPVENEAQMYRVELSRILDEQLLQRSFYWKYMDAIGQQGKTETIQFHFNSSNKDHAYMHEGHPIFTKIKEHLQQSTQFYTGYEKVDTTKKTMLHPYLLVNLLIRFQGKHVVEELHSIGLNLITGQMMIEMMEHINKKQLLQDISPFCYTISPIIRLPSAYKRIEHYVSNYLEQLPHEWAVESNIELSDELAFIEQMLPDEANTKKVILEVQHRLQPSITYEVISGGILHLKPLPVK